MARGIRNPSNNITIAIGNQSSTAKEYEIQNPKSGIHGIKPVYDFQVHWVKDSMGFSCKKLNVPHEQEKIKVMTLGLCQPHFPPQNIRNDLYILSHSTKQKNLFSYLPSVGLMDWGGGGEGGRDIEYE